jgi:hypothetical protein
MITPRDLAHAAALSVLLVTAASADESASPGVARSTNFLALEPDAVVTVRPFDNTRANLALKQQFAAALKKRAIRVDETSAPYVLNFETEVDQPLRRTGPSLASAAGSAHESEVRINVWATNRDSVLRVRPGERADRGTLRYVLIATLEDESTGRRLWQGEAIYDGAPADEAATLAAMASVLADQLGQTVRQKNFRIE